MSRIQSSSRLVALLLSAISPDLLQSFEPILEMAEEFPELFAAPYPLGLRRVPRSHRFRRSKCRWHHPDPKVWVWKVPPQDLFTLE